MTTSRFAFSSRATAAVAALALLTLGTTATAPAAFSATTTVCTSGCDFATIQAAILAAAAGDTITVAAGTYSETLVVNKSVTLLGANAGISPNTGSRGLESVIVGQSTGGYPAVQVTAADVTLDGFDVRNISGTSASLYDIRIDSGGDRATVTRNIVGNTTLTTSSGSGTANGIYLYTYLNGPIPAAGVTVSDNLITNLSATLSAKGIWIGQTGKTPPPIVDAAITGNHITGITSEKKGGYGVLFNVGGYSGYNSESTGLRIQGNTIDAISGAWVHAIGMEGNAPGAVIENNLVSDLRTVGADRAAVFFEATVSSAGTTVSNNSLAETGAYGLATAVAGVVPAASNWWGCATGPGTGCSAVGGTVTSSPWIATYTADPAKNGQPGFWPTDINATTITVSSSDSNSTAGSAVTFSVAVSPVAASGSATLTDDGANMGTCVLAAGTCSVSTGGLSAGSHSIGAAYGGDDIYIQSSSGTITQTVSAVPGPTPVNPVAPHDEAAETPEQEAAETPEEEAAELAAQGEPVVQSVPLTTVPTAGHGDLVVDGRATNLSITSDRDHSTVALAGAGATMSLHTDTSGGTQLPLGSDGNLLVSEDGTAAVQGTGFHPQTWVSVYLFSEPTFLGNLLVAADGSLEGSVPMPAGLEAGRHTLQANGTTTNDGALSVTFAITMVSPAIAASYTTTYIGSMHVAVTNALRPTRSGVPITAVVRDVASGGLRASDAMATELNAECGVKAAVVAKPSGKVIRPLTCMHYNAARDRFEDTWHPLANAPRSVSVVVTLATTGKVTTMRHPVPVQR